MTTLLLVRHGETDWNRENRFQGHADPPLNDLGRRQARELAEALAADPPAAVYTSPLRRARETAAIVADRLGLPLAEVEALREIDVGEWMGLTRAEVEQRYPEDFRRWIGFGQGWQRGETYEQLAERVVPALLALAERHRGDRVLAVTHGGPLRVAQAFAEGVETVEIRRRRLAVENCAVSEFAVEEARLRRLD